MMRSSPPPINLAARKTLEWLDAITTATEGQPVGRVELQGPEDQYEAWKEVERYLLPDTVFSSANLDGVADDLRGRLTFKDSNGRKGATTLRDASSSPDCGQSQESSPETAQATTVNTASNGALANSIDSSTIPAPIRPLLNFVVWRTYHGDSTIAGTGKYILLTNDRITQRQAQKFGVRAKMLGQVSAIVAKTAATQPVLANGKENGRLSMDRPIEPREAADEEPDDEIVFNPAQRPGSSRGKPAVNGQSILPASSNAKILDPDHFGRSPGAKPMTSPKASPVQPHFSGRGQSSPKPAQRSHFQNQQSPMRGSPNNRAQPGPNGRGGRGRGGSMRGAPQINGFGRGGFHPRVGNVNAAQAQQFDQPIDPDSYARPGSTRGRGNGMRKLWNPNT